MAITSEDLRREAEEAALFFKESKLSSLNIAKQKIKDLIITSIKNGGRYVVISEDIPYFLHDELVSWAKDAGITLKWHDDQRDGSYISAAWNF